ncbi:hypothetical protein QJS83_07490 [Bdellovibrio sp. 22V]|uniref:hypothetical protein n=1 Tax=Bdellovibrio TaxID=958 RepID=UPI0025438A9B|nr:hypothetical protein [Bdellovibrio sp. 22V]WII73717.1 hypothetical protein QJS83_07490 [Bdellovibrio sp. 22V]
MKKIIVMAAIFVGSYASAQVGETTVHLDFPSESQWAIGMVNMACGSSFHSDEGYVGTITKTNSGVVYRVFANDDLVARAHASSTSIFARKKCM